MKILRFYFWYSVWTSISGNDICADWPGSQSQFSSLTLFLIVLYPSIYFQRLSYTLNCQCCRVRRNALCIFSYLYCKLQNSF